MISTDTAATSAAFASALPPSFGGDKVVYALALFSILFTCSLSLAVMLNSMRNAWNQRDWIFWNHPLSVNRYILWAFVITIQFMAVPDGVMLLLFGEIAPYTLSKIAFVDRFFDGLAILPCTTALILWYGSKPVINFQLTRQPLPMDLWPTMRDLLPAIKIGAAVLVIAFGVAVGK